MEYQKYRWFYTSSGILVIGGKSDSQNEEVVRLAKTSDIILHTKAPGSPFCVLQDSVEEGAKDIEEAAIFCACFSQSWKKAKGTIEVHSFTKNQVYKEKKSATGTFGIKGEVKKIKAKLNLWLDFQEGKLRAVPFETDIALITPGKMSKEEAVKKISQKLEIPIEEVMSALPSDGIEIKWME